MAGRYPERVSTAVFIAPNVPLAPGHPVRAAAAARFLEEVPEHPGWARWNRAYWRSDFPDFLRFFFSQCFPEADSDAEIAHFLRMGLQTTPEVLLATAGDGGADLTPDLARRYAAALHCPALVIHGDADLITPLARGQELARLSGADLVVLPGSGHEPHCRQPAETNDILQHFLRRTGGR
jgi:pimeloyl-ACP methyl ester carboxylesterase